jgi:hypothetical protein
MATSVGPMQGTGLTNALEMVPEHRLTLSIVSSSLVPTFSNTISNTRPHYSMTINTSAQKTITPDDVLVSYRIAQAKIASYLNKMNLV